MKKIKARLRNWWNSTQFPVATHDDIVAAKQWSLRQESIAVLILLLACAALLFPNLSYPLIEPDETRYAQIALEMNESRDWVTPTLDGKPYLDKPPLIYWLTATSFGVFGNHEFAARLPSVISALATILLTFGLGRRLVGSRGAWLGSITLLLCGGFVMAGRFLILDSLLAFFVIACLLTGYIAVRQHRHCWAWWMISGVACAFGVLTKGPVALVLCAPPLIASGWLRRDQTRTRLLHWIAFVVPMAVGCVPWYVAICCFNPEFIDYFFLEHNFKRFTQGSNHAQPSWFYFPVLFAGMFPTSLLLPSLGVFLVGRSDQKRQLRSKDLGFLFCSAVWILLFFSMASCKLPTYILPAIPLICLMLGGMLDHTVFKPELPNGITAYLKPFPQRATLILALVCLSVVLADVCFRRSLDATLVFVIISCIVFSTVALVAWNRKVAFSPIGWGFTALAAIGVLGFTSSRFVPTVATERSLYAETANIAGGSRDTCIVFFGEKPHAVEMQLATEKVVYFAKEWRDEFVGFVAQHQQLIVITGDEDIEATRIALSNTHELVSTGVHEHLYWARSVEAKIPRVAEASESELR